MLRVCIAIGERLKIGVPSASVAKSTSEATGQPARRWSIGLIFVHRSPKSACSMRLRTETAGPGSS